MTALLSETQTASAKRMYDARASAYDNSWHPAFARRMTEWANLQPGQHVLDLACGTGLVTIPAAKAIGATGRVVAIDISDGMLEEARKKVGKEQMNNVEIIKHDVTRIDDIDALKDSKFDAIIMASALVLLTDADRERDGKLWADFLKPGGVFVVDVLTPDNQPENLILERIGKGLGHPLPWNRDWVKDERSISDFLEVSGLRVDRIFPVEQTGELTRCTDEDEADGYAKKQLSAEHTRGLVAAATSDSTEFTLDDVKAAFKDEWRTKADGRLKIEDRVWIAIAKKI